MRAIVFCCALTVTEMLNCKKVKAICIKKTTACALFLPLVQMLLIFC